MLWPETLPQDVLVQGYQATLPDGAVRTSMDSGPEFARQRFTAAPEPFSATIRVDKEEYRTLVAFYVNDTAHGTIPFDWHHPITKDVAAMQFTGPPRVTAASGLYYDIQLSLQVLP